MKVRAFFRKVWGSDIFRADIINIPILFAFSMLVFFESEWIARSSMQETFAFIRTASLQSVLSTLFIFVVAVLLYALFRKACWPVLITGVLFTVAASVNHIKSTIRDEPFLPWDISVAGAGMKAAQKTKIDVSYQIIISLLTVALCFYLLFIFRKNIKSVKVKMPIRTGTAVVLACFVAVYTKGVFMNSKYISVHRIKEYKFNQLLNTQQNGFVFTYLMDMKYVNVSKPKGYNEANVKKAVKAIKTKKTGSEKPNIIIIQDEALCDANLFKNVQYGSELTPNIDNCQKNYVSGYTLTPQFGGGTCNSEFEVLTGMSCSYLPAGSYPYQQYIKRTTPSYASFLDGLGYSTIAVHSFERTFFNRNNVYKYFGFNKFIAQDNFVNPERKRTYISDMQTFKMITDQYEQNKSTGKPFFNFTVTMENHASWSKNDYPEDERVKLDAPAMSDADRDDFVSYATGVRDADAALGYLMNYFSNVKEPTIIVMYGDHLPGLTDSTYTTGGYTDGTSSAKNTDLMHSTPFVVWSNYQKKHLNSVNLSMYELVPYITRVYNIQRPPFFDYLLDEYDHYRGNAAGIFINPDNQPVYALPSGSAYYYKTQYLLEYDLLMGRQYSKSIMQ